MLMVAGHHDVGLTVVVEVGERRRRRGKFGAVTGSPALLRESKIVVHLRRGHDPVGKTRRRRKGPPIALEDPEADAVVGADHIRNPIPIEVGGADVLIVAAKIPAGFSRWRRVTTGGNLWPTRQLRAVGAVDAGHRARPG